MFFKSALELKIQQCLHPLCKANTTKKCDTCKIFYCIDHLKKCHSEDCYRDICNNCNLITKQYEVTFEGYCKTCLNPKVCRFAKCVYDGTKCTSCDEECCRTHLMRCNDCKTWVCADHCLTEITFREGKHNKFGSCCN